MNTLSGSEYDSAEPPSNTVHFTVVEWRIAIHANTKTTSAAAAAATTHIRRFFFCVLGEALRLILLFIFSAFSHFLVNFDEVPHERFDLPQDLRFLFRLPVAIMDER